MTAIPAVSGKQERFLVLKDIELPGLGRDAEKQDDQRPVESDDHVDERPAAGLAIGNVGADAFFDLEIEGLPSGYSPGTAIG